MDNVKANVANLTSKVNGSVIAMLIFAVLITFVVAYGLYWYITSSVLKKQMYVYPDSKIPKRGDSLQEIPNTQATFSKNGARKSIAFWLYVHDISQTTSGPRNIIRVGSNITSPTDMKASPYVFMDGTDTKLYMVFKTNTDLSKKTYTATSDLEKYKELAQTDGIVLPYVPIQRWVHIALVINETGAGGTLTAYVDAEPVVSVQRKVYNFKLDVEGSLFIGGNNSDGFAGLVSGVTICNYDLNAQDIYNIYKKGPIDNLFARLGLPAYGVRSPLYRI